MDFLPVLKDGKKVYAGFWKRCYAATVDIFVWLPVAFFFHYVQSINLSIAIAGAVAHAFFFSIYSIYFNLKYGGSLGKLSVGIRVTKPNGTKIGPREAFLRSSVDIVYGISFAIIQVYAINQVDLDAYLAAGYIERAKLITPLYPGFSKYMDTLLDVWYWSEIIVLLFNKRKRSLHDFIAGTVVVHKEYA